MFNQNLFIQRLIFLRKEHNLSQAQLGEIINLSKQGVNEIEKGRTTTRIDKLAIIADYFNVSTDYLLGRTDNPEVNK
ncbi:helix-turn-helix transcriptional regulator [Sinanaerobacter sp. ZZT-01]|uniref:helix-turn-helix domain-containing protein n=1 Tax=Sinanaerobacter sp. ZZT-01 TaxID=3111540 RepID=UPI002D765F70|nr:helix-turn-helix transcriptional regulator [Sinanaerobacter sp. ZZT-01]WRR94220.1 helix-turn-helix transcriptional regulator [Sinanaerobacter sp. ZZT-01]